MYVLKKDENDSDTYFYAQISISGIGVPRCCMSVLAGRNQIFCVSGNKVFPFISMHRRTVVPCKQISITNLVPCNFCIYVFIWETMHHGLNKHNDLEENWKVFACVNRH